MAGKTFTEVLAQHQRINELLDQGMNPSVIARSLGCSRSTVYAVRRNRSELTESPLKAMNTVPASVARPKPATATKYQSGQIVRWGRVLREIKTVIDARTLVLKPLKGGNAVIVTVDQIDPD